MSGQYKIQLTLCSC